MSKAYLLVELFEKAKWGTELSADEIQFVKAKLSDLNQVSWQEESIEKYHLALMIVGITEQATEANIKLVERFTDKSWFCDEITSSALKVLCRFDLWNLSQKYEKQLYQIVEEHQEMFEETTGAALLCLGYLGHVTRSKKVVSFLFSKFQEAVRGQKDDTHMGLDVEVLYDALQTIVWGNDYKAKERRVTVGDMRIPEDISPTLMATIENILQTWND